MVNPAKKADVAAVKSGVKPGNAKKTDKPKQEKQVSTVAESVGSAQQSMKPGQPVASRGAWRPTVHIDIQVHISPDSSPEQIDKIFESMAKHLKDFNSDAQE